MALRIKGPSAELNFPDRAFASAAFGAAPPGPNNGFGGASSGNGGAPATAAAAHSRDGDDAAPQPPALAGRASLVAAEALGTMMHGHHAGGDGSEAPAALMGGGVQQHPHPAPPKRRRSGRGDTHVHTGAIAAAPAAAVAYTHPARGAAASAAFDAQMSYVSDAEAFVVAPLQCVAFIEAMQLARGSPQARAAWAAECRRRMAARAGSAATAAAARAAALFFESGGDSEVPAHLHCDAATSEAALRCYIDALRRAFPAMLLEPFVLSAAALAEPGDDDDDETASPALRAAQRRAAAALRALRLCARRPVVFVPEGAGAVHATSALDAALRLPNEQMPAALEAAMPMQLRAAVPGGAVALLAPSPPPPWLALEAQSHGGGMCVDGFAPPGAPLPLLRRCHVAASSTLLVAPLATAAASARLDAIHSALWGDDVSDSNGCTGASSRLLPLEQYLEESLPLVTWQRDRAGADIAELPPLCRTAQLRWRVSDDNAPLSATGAAARADCCARAELLPAYLLAKLACIAGDVATSGHTTMDAAPERAAWAAVAGAPQPPPPAMLAVRAAEALSRALSAAPHADDAAHRMRPAAARAALLALRPALVDLVQLAPPAAESTAAMAVPGAVIGHAASMRADPASSAAVAARAAAPLSREAAASALAAADVALASAPVAGPSCASALEADVAAEAEAAAAGALCWLERYLCAPAGSMMRAALVTAAQEAPLSVRCSVS